MRARYLIFTTMVLVVPMLSAQSFEWGFGLTAGQFDNPSARSTVMDDQADVITIGTFLNTLDLDPGPGVFNVTSVGDADVYIQKVDAMGNFLWGASFGGGSSDWAESVAVDGDGNIVLTGRVAGTVDLDPGPGTDLVTTPNTVFAVYVLKLDGTGQYLWGRIFGGLGNDAGRGIATDPLGNIITVGTLGNGGDLDPGPGLTTVSSAGQQDIFVQKMDPDGGFLWGKAMGGSANDIAYDVAVADDGAVLVTGEFRTTADLDPGPGTALLTSAGAEDIMVVKLQADGLFAWARRMGGTGSERARSIAVGPDGGAVITGRITSVTDFDPGIGVFDLPGSNLEDAFIGKLSAEGDFGWAFLLSTFLNEGLGVDVDPDGNVYATGTFGSFSGIALDLDPGSGQALVLNNGGSDVWVATYTGEGAFRWGFAVGSAQSDVSNCISVGPSKRVAIAGFFRQTIDMDPSSALYTLTAPSGSSTGAFTAVYGLRDPEAVHVRLIALLQGAYQEGPWPMRDQLRSGGWLPLEEPYSAMGFVLDAPAVTNPLVLSWTLSSAIVDWILVEVRDPLEPSTVLARKAGLLRVGGSVVSADGVSPLGFELPPGEYHVALRHRNHLGVMTAAPVVLANAPIMIDLRDPSTPTFGLEARRAQGLQMLMWSGNVLYDDALKYTGAENDRDPILSRIGGAVPTATLAGYWPEDVNMDGVVKYTGAENDRDPILQNIGGVLPTAVRDEQLP